MNKISDDQHSSAADHSPNTTRRSAFVLPWVLGGLFLVSATWFLVLYNRGVEKDTLDMEFAKALLSVGLVSVAATILSLLVFSHQRQVEREERARERRAEEQRQAIQDDRERLAQKAATLKATLSRVTEAYNNSKRARRKMRALGCLDRHGAIKIRLSHYDECMAEVNDAQLELEAIKSDVKTNAPAYGSVDALRSSLRSMESYLGELLHEYEGIRARTTVGTELISLEAAPLLADFLGPASGSQFVSRFSNEYDRAREAIRAELLAAGFGSG